MFISDLGAEEVTSAGGCLTQLNDHLTIIESDECGLQMRRC